MVRRIRKALLTHREVVSRLERPELDGLFCSPVKVGQRFDFPLCWRRLFFDMLWRWALEKRGLGSQMLFAHGGS